MEMPRAWTENGIKRRISLAMLAGFVLKAIAANCEPLPIGPWDRRPQPTAGRLANYLDIHIQNFVTLALAGVKSRKSQKFKTLTIARICHFQMLLRLVKHELADLLFYQEQTELPIVPFLRQMLNL